MKTLICYFHIDSIAKMLTARSDNGVTKSYKFKKSFDIIKMARSSKILMPAEIISMSRVIKRNMSRDIKRKKVGVR